MKRVVNLTTNLHGLNSFTQCVIHAIERKHNENFRNLINKKFCGHDTMERGLLTYWFLIQESQSKPHSQNSKDRNARLG